MGTLKKMAKSVWNSFEDGSKQIGEAFGGSDITGKSDKTKRKIEAATPPVIPEADDDVLRRERRRRLAGQAGRSGRAATILSQDDDQLG